MRTQNGKYQVRVMAVAVQSVLAAMFAMPAHADDAEALALKTPTNFMQMGVSNVNRDSAKFGEYTGLNKSGAYVNGGFSVRGGDSYGGGEGTMRWSVTGDDVGLTSRNFGATVSDQGKWDLRIGFDELRHNISDTYQTPYTQGNGSGTWTLPAGFGTIANTRTLSAAQLGAFHNLDVSSTRENILLGAGMTLGAGWTAKLDYNHLDQSGAKLQAFGAGVIGTSTGEKVSILPMPTDSKTDTVNLALNWAGEKAHATGAYYGSFYRNNVNGVSFMTWGGGNNMETMTTPPSNDFHQLNLNGGYALNATTKLAGGLSYGRNTQNSPFAYDPGMMVTASPTASLNGSITTKHADAKLTNQTTKDLVLTAGLKYDARDNNTASNIYNANAIDGAHPYAYPNTPLSTKKAQLELAGDYRLSRTQQLRLAYNRENVDRWCNQYAVNANYPAGTNCVTATGSKEDKLNATYRFKATDDIRLSAGYTFSNRQTTFDEAARVAMLSLNGNAIVAGATVTGVNGGDFLGFHPWFEGSRKEHVLKAGASWQATEDLTVDLNGRYLHDIYDTSFGFKDGTSASINIDTTYTISEDSSITAYFTRQHWKRDLTDEQVSPTGVATAANATRITIPTGATWSNGLKDIDTVIGLAFKRANLMGGKLDLNAEATYSLGESIYSTGLNYFTTTTAPAQTCAAAIIMSCGTLPPITSRMVQFKLSGAYKLDKSASVVGGLLYRSLNATDYSYNGLDFGNVPNNVLPTGQQTGNYSVVVLSAAYQYKFQ